MLGLQEVKLMNRKWHNPLAPPAVVIGLNINGLGTVRALGRKGISVYAVARGEGSPSEYTRYCKKVVCNSMTSSAEDLLSCLVAIGQKLPGKSVLFPSGDLYLEIVSENRERLTPYYHFPFASKETVRLILDKYRFYKYSQGHRFPIANTFFPRDINDVKLLAGNIRYPCLIKPSVASIVWRQRGLKILLANNAGELVKQFELAFGIHPELIIQEVTPGPDSALHFSLTYLDRSGSPLVMFTGRKLRQFVPRFGISSMAESLWSPVIAESTETILRALGYTGYGSIEFKMDPRDNEFKMTEVTGRTWYPHALSERCGINIPYIAYCDLLGTEIREPVPKTYPQHAKWIDELGDFRSAYRYWKEGSLSLRAWIRSYNGKRFYATFSRDDILPGVIFVLRTGQLLFRLLAQRCLAMVRGSAKRIKQGSL